MTLLHLQSFDDESTAQYPGWSSSTWHSSAARTGIKGTSVGDATNQSSTFAYTDQPETTIMGVAWRPTDIGPDPSRFLHMRGSENGIDLLLWLRGNGAIYLDYPGGTSSDSATGLITLGVWYYLEVKYLSHNSTGTYEVRINETTVLSDTGVDTQSGTQPYSASIYFPGSVSSTDMDRCHFDDFYLCDATGGENDDFLGDTAVHSLYPIGDGNASNMDGSDGNQVDNWELVNEATPSDTDYVEGLTEGTIDTYQMESLSSTAYVVHGIQTAVSGLKSDVGLKYMRHVVRTGSTGGAQSDNVSDGYLLSSVKITEPRIWSQNPATASTWTEGEINAMNIGQEARDSTSP